MLSRKKAISKRVDSSESSGSRCLQHFRSETRVAYNERHCAEIQPGSSTESDLFESHTTPVAPTICRSNRPARFDGRNATWPASARERVSSAISEMYYTAPSPRIIAPICPFPRPVPFLDASTHTSPRAQPRLPHPSVLCLCQSNYPPIRKFLDTGPPGVIRSMEIATRGAGRGVIGLMEIFRWVQTALPEK